MAWRVAKSLLVLRDQLNQAHPNRNKASDGTIGDPNHQAEGSGSDHNPNKAGVVCAIDITHDPANGVDIVALAEALADSQDNRIKYMIRNSRIMVPADFGWAWVGYNGNDPHTSHLHLSVYGQYDDETKWNIGKEQDMITKENFLEIAQAAGFTWGKDFNYDPNMSLDEFTQLANSQAPRITKDMENTVADGITGIKNVVGWGGYNSPFIGQKVSTHYPAMVEFWTKQSRAPKPVTAVSATQLKPGIYEVK